MLPNSFPLDIAQTIIDTYTLPGERYLSRSRATLKACSLVCRAWRPLAQRHLLHTIVLVPPPKPVRPPKKPKPASIWTTKSRKRKKPASEPLPPPPPPPPSPVESLLQSMENDESWVQHVQYLRIEGKWLISAPEFPKVLETLCRFGRTKRLVWDMGCREECRCRYDVSEELQNSIEKLFSIPSLTTVWLKEACRRFVGEILRQSGLPRPEVLPPHKPSKHLTVETQSCTRIYSLDAPDYQLRMDRVEDLELINFKHAWSDSDGSGLFNTIIDNAAESLNTLTWLFGATTWDDQELSFRQDNIEGINFRRLKALRTVNIEAWFGKYEDDPADFYPNFKHYRFIETILEQCLSTETVETVNILIEDNPFPDDYDLGINGRFWNDVTNEVMLDEKLAEVLSPAIAKGHLKSVKISIVVTGRKESFEQARDEVLSGYERTIASCSTSEGSEVAAESSGEGGMSVGLKEDWMRRNPGKTDDDFLEAWCRDQDDDWGAKEDFIKWRHFHREVAAEIFPEIQKVEGVEFEVIDVEDY